MQEHELTDTALLIKCLIIVCRHFDNIGLIVRSNFISCCIEICQHLLTKTAANRALLSSEVELVKVSCQFLEFLYDPYFQWRNFCTKHEYIKSSLPESSTTHLHAEIIPFMYTCFEDFEKKSVLNTSGCYLLNILGGIVIGSHKNGQKVICPATVKIVIHLLSTWVCESELRDRALKLFNVMMITLLKSSPVQRQIELNVVIENYQEAINSLLSSLDFLPKSRDEAFEISSNEECLDVHALESILGNISLLLEENSTKYQVSRSLIEANFLTTLVDVPMKIQNWDIDRQAITVVVIRNVCNISHEANHLVSKRVLGKLWTGIKGMGKAMPALVEECLSMISNPKDRLCIDCFVLNEVIKWLPEVNQREQEIMSKSLITICLRNLNWCV